MSKMQVFICAFYVLSFANVSQAVDPGTDLVSDKIWIREGGNDYEVTFSLTAGQAVWWDNDKDCGTNGHKTAAKAPAVGRFYGHVHINYGFGSNGIPGVDQNMANRTITATKIKDYYDNVYAGYGSNGTEDLTKNCHAHAFGKNTWINKPEYIDADEHQAATNWRDCKYLRDTNVNGHTILVTNCVAGTVYDTIDTSEKNGQSRIYTASWGTSSPAITTKMKDK